MLVKRSGALRLTSALWFYHFWVEVFDILRVENGHEGLCAHGLAAVFLPHHQRYVLWVVLKVVDERLALASDGLGDKHTRFSLTEKPQRTTESKHEAGSAGLNSYL